MVNIKKWKLYKDVNLNITRLCSRTKGHRAIPEIMDNTDACVQSLFLSPKKIFIMLINACV